MQFYCPYIYDQIIFLLPLSLEIPDYTAVRSINSYLYISKRFKYQ